MARVLSSVSREPPVLRWLHALDPARNVDSVLLHSSICYSCSFPPGHAAPPKAELTVSSIFIPMYVRPPFILGQSHSPTSPNVMALSLLCAPNPPPQARFRRFVVDLNSTKPIEFIEYEWMDDGKLCVSLHEISEDGLYSGQTIIFDGPPKPGSTVPSRVAMRLHYKESPLPGSGKQALEVDWRDKPNSWETWGGIFARFRTGKMSICTKYAVSSAGGPCGEFFSKLDETCVIGETAGNNSTNSMSNRLIRLFLQMYGMMVPHPSQDENITRAADQRMLTDAVMALDDEDSPMFSSLLELENGQHDDSNGNGNSDAAIQIDIEHQYMMNTHPMDDPEIIEEEMGVDGANPSHQQQPLHNNIPVPSLEHSQGNSNVNSESEGPYIPPPQELLPPPEPVYAPIPSRPLSSFSMPVSETNSGIMSLSLPAPGHAKAASMSTSIRSTDTMPPPRHSKAVSMSMSIRSSDTTPIPTVTTQMTENSNQLHLAHLLSDEVSPIAAEMNNAAPNINMNMNLNSSGNDNDNSATFLEINPHNNSSSPSNQSCPSAAADQSTWPPYQQHRRHEAPVIFPNASANGNSKRINNGSSSNASNGIIVNPASPANPHTVQPLGTHPVLPLLSPDANGNGDANGNVNGNVNGHVSATPSPVASIPMRAVSERIVVPLPPATAARSCADPASSSLSRLSLTQRANGAKSAPIMSAPPKGSNGTGFLKGIKKQKSTERKPASRGVHLCTLCGQKFSHRGHFNAHMKAVHQKIRNHKCTYPGCERPFAKRGDLLRHQMSQHSQGVRYPCSECAIIFPNKLDLGKHFSQVHYKDKPFKCKLCPKTYSTGSGLRKHQHSKHGKKETKRDHTINGDCNDNDEDDNDNNNEARNINNTMMRTSITTITPSTAPSPSPPASAAAVPIAG